MLYALCRIMASCKTNHRNQNMNTKANNRKYVKASRERDAAKGIARVEVRIPESKREELLQLCVKWRNGYDGWVGSEN